MFTRFTNTFQEASFQDHIEIPQPQLGKSTFKTSVLFFKVKTSEEETSAFVN